MHALRLTRIGSELAVVVPRDALVQYGLHEGDLVYLSRGPVGAELATSLEAGGQFCADPATIEQLHAGHEFMRDFHAAFRVLAR